MKGSPSQSASHSIPPTERPSERRRVRPEAELRADREEDERRWGAQHREATATPPAAITDANIARLAYALYEQRERRTRTGVGRLAPSRTRAVRRRRRNPSDARLVRHD